MRRSLRFAIVALTLVLVGTVAGLVARSLWEQKRGELLSAGVELIPGVAQHIQNFRRVKVKEGRKMWEVAATDAQLFEADNVVVIRGALLKLHLEDGGEIGLESDEGRVVLEERDVKRVELRGKIRVSLVDYTVEAEEAVYDDDADKISVPGKVHIYGKRVELTGTGMEVDVPAQRMRLLSDVAMQVRDASGGPRGGSHATL